MTEADPDLLADTLGAAASISAGGHCRDARTDHSAASLRDLVAVGAGVFRVRDPYRGSAHGGRHSSTGSSAGKLRPDLGANLVEYPRRRGLPTDAMPIYRATWTFDWCRQNSCVSLCPAHERILMGRALWPLGSKRTARLAHAHRNSSMELLGFRSRSLERCSAGAEAGQISVFTLTE